MIGLLIDIIGYCAMDVWNDIFKQAIFLLFISIISGCAQNSSNVTSTISITMTQPSNETTQLNEASLTGVIVIQGIFDPTGQELRELKPIRFYSRRFTPNSYQPEGYFNVEVHYVNRGMTIHPFDALVAGDSATEELTHGFFEVEVPVDGDVDFIRISDRSNEIIFAQIEAADIQH